MKNRILILGEAYGEHEERERMPFVGPTGYELTRMLTEAGINRADCYLTNVFNLRPKNNKIEDFCGGKAEGIPGYPALTKGKYVRREFEPELERLGEELLDINPNIIIAMGNTACWAVLGQSTITKVRGNTTLSTHTVADFKVLPTYHPAAVFRQWQLRPIVIMDLVKAERESHFPEIRRPYRAIWIEPTLEDMERFYSTYIQTCELLSVDIETAGTHITCIGFAPSPTLALVIPFHDATKANRSYWPTKELELLAWQFVRRVIENPQIKKTFQNGLYDIAFLWRAYGIRTFGSEHDPMLLHHALQPESLKGLGFLGSIYTDEGSWKHMRVKTTIKRDD